MIEEENLVKDGFVFKKDRLLSQRPRGCWYNENTNERLFPVLGSDKQADRYWHYYGPNFPCGTRLYIDGTWIEK